MVHLAGRNGVYDLLLACLGRIEYAYQFAQPEYGNPIRYFKDIMQIMGNNHDR